MRLHRSAHTKAGQVCRCWPESRRPWPSATRQKCSLTRKAISSQHSAFSQKTDWRVRGGWGRQQSSSWFWTKLIGTSHGTFPVSPLFIGTPWGRGRGAKNRRKSSGSRGRRDRKGKYRMIESSVHGAIGRQDWRRGRLARRAASYRSGSIIAGEEATAVWSAATEINVHSSRSAI